MPKRIEKSPTLKAFERRLRKGERTLSSSCEQLAAWIAEYGRCQLSVAWDRSPYEALVRAIAFQQLHGKAAQSILNRLIAICPGEEFPSPESIARLSLEQMRSCGFSQAKALSIQGIAQAARAGEIPTREQAEDLSDEDLIARLIPLRGVGRWTVEMLLIFTLGRLDVMPVDDYGVQAGLTHLLALQTLPKKKHMLDLTSHWSPYRSLGAWYMWRLAEARRSP